MTKKLLMGNEAMAHAALEAGVGVVAGYPGTPSSEIVETVARQYRRGAAHGVHVEWSTNEKVALELLFGASLAGKRGLFTCKQMGLNVASDALMSLNYVSVRAGLVLIVADDPGPISSQTEQDTRRFAAFAKVPVLDPASPEQAFEMVKAAFDLSERFHTPVIVRPTTRVDHASAFIDVREETHARTPIAAMSGPIIGLGDAGDGRGSDGSAGRAAATASLSPLSYGSGAMNPLATGFVPNPGRWVIFPRRAYEAHGEINERLVEISHVFATNPTFSQFNPIEEVAATESPMRQTRAHARPSAQAVDRGVTFGILASGISAAYTREALRAVANSAAVAGVRVPAYRFMQVGTPFPFPEAAVAQFTKGLAEILVIEELDYVLEDELTRFAGRTHASFNVHGKLTGEARDRGENDVDDIISRLERFLGLTGRLSLFRLRDETRNATFGDSTASGALSVELDEEAEADLPERPPVLCAGCPHRASFYAVKSALGDVPAVMCGDIGCYTLGNAKPLETIDTCLCMGGGITMAQGIAVADPDKKAIAYVGDSTFFASGLTGLANAAYNNHDITVMVLDNSTTAMTGAQPHPGTGETLMGEYSEPLDYETSLVACGITHVYHANPLDLKASIVAVRAAISYEGPSAVVFSSPCAQLVPPDPPTLVNRDVCTGCRRCITSIGCPALNFNKKVNGPRSHERGQAVVDANLCVGCNLCVQVCPFKAIIPGEVVAKRKATETTLQPEGKAALGAAAGSTASGSAAPAWPPYSANAMPEPPSEDAEGDREKPTGMRASLEAQAAVEAFSKPIKSGIFKSFPKFDNPWKAGKTDTFPPVGGEDSKGEPESEHDSKAEAEAGSALEAKAGVESALAGESELAAESKTESTSESRLGRVFKRKVKATPSSEAAPADEQASDSAAEERAKSAEGEGSVSEGPADESEGESSADAADASAGAQAEMPAGDAPEDDEPTAEASEGSAIVADASDDEEAPDGEPARAGARASASASGASNSLTLEDGEAFAGKTPDRGPSDSSVPAGKQGVGDLAADESGEIPSESELVDEELAGEGASNATDREDESYLDGDADADIGRADRADDDGYDSADDSDDGFLPIPDWNARPSINPVANITADSAFEPEYELERTDRRASAADAEPSTERASASARDSKARRGHAQDHLPDFGIAAEFEDELEDDE